MSTGLLEILLLGERALEQRMAGVALVQPNLAASFTVKPEVDQGAMEFFIAFTNAVKKSKLPNLSRRSPLP